MKLDVIIPIHNKQDKIDEIISDIKDLLKDINYNIIFIDNNSNDKTNQILKELSKKSDNIKVIELSKKHSLNECMLLGIKHSTSDLICTLTANDEINYIKRMYNFLVEKTDYDGVLLCNKTKTNIFRKILLNIINKNINDSISNVKMFRKCMKDSIIEYSSIYNYSNLLFNFIGFNLYYDYTYNRNIKHDNINKYVFLNTNLLLNFSYTLSILSIIYLIISLLLTIKISIIISIMLLLFSFNLLVINYIIKHFFKKNIITIKNKIGFDNNYL